METRSKQILAVVLIVVVIGAGFGLYLLLPTTGIPTGRLFTPGAPDGTPRDHIIVVGVLGSITEIQGAGEWRGAYLACQEINEAGGVDISGETYYFGVVCEDTYESDAQLDISRGTAAATRIVSQDHAQFIVGGFRTEAVMAYREIIMDNHLIFIGTGASTDSLCQNVTQNYARYKYWFRNMPINSTSLALELLKYLLYVRGYLAAVTSLNITKVAIIREDLDWTIPMDNFLKFYLPNKTANAVQIVEDIAFDISAEATAFAAHWQTIQDSGAQITIPIISAQGGILMTTQYQAVKPKCLIAGIDVMAQEDTYWNETNGACEYEVLLQSTVRTNKTTKTIDFWDAFLDMWGHEPLYTAVGAYDAMYLILHGISEAQSLNADDIIPELEALSRENPLEGAGGNAYFYPTHDIVEGYDPVTGVIYGVTLFVQWQADGAKECVTSGGYVYPSYVATAGLTLPPWGINP